MINNAKIKCWILLIISIFLFQKSIAQEDEKSEEDPSEQYDLPKDNVSVLKLKKGYKLGDGLRFSSAIGSFDISQTFQTLFGIATANKDLSGMQSQFDIPRARLLFESNLFDQKIAFVFKINFAADNQSATSGNRSFNNTIQEAYVEYRPRIAHTFNIGLRADYVDSRELRIEGENLGFIDRSAVVDAFDAIFDFGLRYKGSYKLGGKNLLRPYVSVTTGDSRAALQKNFGGYKFGIRLDYLPFDKFSEGGEFYMEDLAREIKPKLVVGVVYSYNNGQSSAQGTNGGRYIYGDIDQNILLPDFFKAGIDYMFKYRGFYSMGSYYSTSTQIPQGIAGEFKLNGQFDPYTGQTPADIEATVLSRLNVGSGFNIQGGYILPSDWAFGARYAYLNSDPGAAEFANYNKFYSLVTTKYFAKHRFKIQIEVDFNELKENLKTATSAGNYFLRTMITLQL